MTNNWHQATANLLDPKNRVTFLKALDGYDSLSDEERLQFHVLAAQFPDRFDTMLHFEALGITKTKHLSGMYGALIRDFMSHPGFKSFYRAEHHYFSPTMKAWVARNCPGIDGLGESGYLAEISRGGEGAA